MCEVSSIWHWGGEVKLKEIQKVASAIKTSKIGWQSEDESADGVM